MVSKDESQRTPTRKRKAKQQPVEDKADANKGDGNSDYNNSNASTEKKSYPLLRDESKGMNPVSLLTGYYGTRGERIRHVAQTGALHLPKDALDILLARTIEKQADQKIETTTGTKKKAKGPILPGLDSVVRTSLDHDNYESMMVTQVSKIKTTVTPQPVRISNPDGTFQFQQPPQQIVWKTHVHNKMIALRGDETARIRGGGDDGSQQPPSQTNNTTAPAGAPPAQPQQQPASAPAAQPAPVNTQQQPTAAPTTSSTQSAASKPALAMTNEQKIQEQQMQLKKLHQQTVQARQQQQLEQLRRQHEQSMQQMQQDESKKLQEDQARAQQAQKQQLIQRQQEQLRTQHEQIRKQQAEQQQRLAQQQGMTQQPTSQKSAVSGTIPMTQAGPPQPAAKPVAATASAPASTTTSLPTLTAAQRPAQQPALQQQQQPSTQSQVAPAQVAGTKTAPTPTPSQPSSDARPAISQGSSKPPSQRGFPVAVGLKKVPNAQWEQHMPGPNDEMAVDPSTKTPKPEWYKPDRASNLEMTLLPEWFDGSAVHRTKETYLKGRETMLKISSKLGTRYLTATMARRSIPGDAGSLIRLHEFLEAHGLINEDSVNDSAPTPAALQAKTHEQVSWPLSRRHALVNAVVEHSRKRAKMATEGQDGLASIDWKSIADDIGDGATSEECEKQFLVMDIEEEPEVDNQRSITPETTPVVTSSDLPGDTHKRETEQSVSGVSMDWVDSCDPQVVHAVTEAALTSTASLREAQKAAVGGLELSHDLQDVVSREGEVARMLSEVVELRMKKLENRLALLDDVEGLLDAERVALELERRDLYTSRCRHWFGGA